jgi:hypothetical protein
LRRFFVWRRERKRGNITRHPGLLVMDIIITVEGMRNENKMIYHQLSVIGIQNCPWYQ